MAKYNHTLFSIYAADGQNVLYWYVEEHLAVRDSEYLLTFCKNGGGS